MHVAVCIVSFANPNDVARCLKSLELAHHADFEVMICENGGADAYAALTERIPAALLKGQRVTAVLAAENLGYAAGVNTCIRHTPEADAWWVLNPDTAPEPSTLAALVSKLTSGTCDLVGSVTHFPNGVVESAGGRWNGWLGRSVALGYGRKLTEEADLPRTAAAASYFSGASLFVGRTFLDVVGPMREDYFLYCEEIEWCLRAGALGMRLNLEPSARVLHFQGTTTGSVADIRDRPRTPVYLDERNKVLVTRDCFPKRLPVAAAAAFLVLFARYLRRGAWRQFIYGLQGWADGLRNKRGRPKWVAP